MGIFPIQLCTLSYTSVSPSNHRCRRLLMYGRRGDNERFRTAFPHPRRRRLASGSHCVLEHVKDTRVTALSDVKAHISARCLRDAEDVSGRQYDLTP
jgi:hypothetical protein